MPVVERCHKHGIATLRTTSGRESTRVFMFPSRSGDELEAENAKLKRMLADLALKNAAIKDALNRKS